MKQLRSRSKVKVWEAATAISRTGNKEQLVPLLRQLRHGIKPFHRAAAAYALRGVGYEHTGVIDELIHTLSDTDENPEVRGQAAETLADLSANAAIPALIKCLSDRSKSVCSWSAFALGVAGSLCRQSAKRSIPELRRLTETDHRVVRGFWTVAEEAEWAIARLEQREEDSARIERRCEAALKKNRIRRT